MMSRATAFGIRAESVDGQDVRAVCAAAEKLVDQGRRGQGPSFLLCNTYRYHGHHVGDINREYYRSKEEEQRWKTERDPLKLLAGWMLEQGLVEAGDFDRIQGEAKAEIEAAVKFALSAPYPNPEEVEQDVYA
jgi:pyruvate dehydrogenase E1 component alpha subunit